MVYKLAQFGFLANLYTRYNLLLEQTGSRKKAIESTIEMYTTREPFNVLEKDDVTFLVTEISGFTDCRKVLGDMLWPCEKTQNALPLKDRKLIKDIVSRLIAKGEPIEADNRTPETKKEEPAEVELRPENKRLSEHMELVKKVVESQGFPFVPGSTLVKQMMKRSVDELNSILERTAESTAVPCQNVEKVSPSSMKADEQKFPQKDKLKEKPKRAKGSFVKALLAGSEKEPLSPTSRQVLKLYKERVHRASALLRKQGISPSSEPELSRSLLRMSEEEFTSLEERLSRKSNDSTTGSQISDEKDRTPPDSESEEEVEGKRTAKLPIEEFVRRAIQRLRKPPHKGIHSVRSGFDQAFMTYYSLDSQEMAAAIKMLEMDGWIVTRLAKTGLMLYLPEDAVSLHQRRGILQPGNEQESNETTIVGRVESVAPIDRTYFPKITISTDVAEYSVLPNRLSREFFDLLHQEVEVTGIISEINDRKLLWPKNYGIQVRAPRHDTREVTIIGEILPKVFDRDGRPSAISVETSDNREYRVDLSGAGKELLAFPGKYVWLTCIIREGEDGTECVKVHNYEIWEEGESKTSHLTDRGEQEIQKPIAAATLGQVDTKTEKMSVIEFVIRAIRRLREPPNKGIHMVLSGFAEAFREYYNMEPEQAIARLESEGKIATRSSADGVTIYLPEEAPITKSLSSSMFSPSGAGNGTQERVVEQVRQTLPPTTPAPPITRPTLPQQQDTVEMKKRQKSAIYWALGISVCLPFCVLFLGEASYSFNAFMRTHPWVFYISAAPFAVVLILVLILGGGIFSLAIVQGAFEHYHEKRTEGESPSTALVSTLIVFGLMVLIFLFMRYC